MLQSKKLTLKKIMNSIMNFVMIKRQKRNLKNQKKSGKSLLRRIKHLLHPVTKKKRRKNHQTMKHTPKRKKKIKDLTSQLRKGLQEWPTQQNLLKRWKVPMKKAAVSILKMKGTKSQLKNLTQNNKNRSKWLEKKMNLCTLNQTKMKEKINAIARRKPITSIKCNYNMNNNSMNNLRMNTITRIKNKCKFWT